MNDDIEQRLARLMPRGVPAELRGRVLGAVAGQLKREPPSPWLRRAGWATAASILVGVALNVWVNRAADRQMAQLLGPPPACKSAASPAEYYAAVNRMIRELQGFSKGVHDETHENDPEMDRGRPRRTGGGRTGCERLSGMDYRYTA